MTTLQPENQTQESLTPQQQAVFLPSVFPPQAVVYPPAVQPDIAATLRGVIVKLRELTHDDLPALYSAICKPEVFAQGWGGGIANYRSDYVGWEEFMLGYLRLGGEGNVYAVCSLVENERIVGTTTLADFDLKHASAHIGWTAYNPDYWASGVNAESKYLLLNAAFENGFERIRIQVDSHNVRSKAAIERLGAVYEGTMRHTRRRGDGSWSDSAVYSILSEEWPAVKSRLEARIAKHAPQSAA